MAHPLSHVQLVLLAAPLAGAFTLTSVPLRPRTCSHAVNMVEQLDEESWGPAMDSFDGLTVVKFYAPWCRTCRAVGPVYERAATRLELESPSKVKFFEVNFKAQKELCLKERVFALPTVHFYIRGLGRVNGFTLKNVGSSVLLEKEISRYLGDSDHLNLLQSLRAEALGPVVRYVDLVSVMQALSEASKFSASAKSASPVVQQAVSTSERRQELNRLFESLDANSDGVLDEGELATVAAAVAPMGGTGETSASELLQRLGCAQGESPLELPLTREAFIDMMSVKAMAEFSTPDKELLPAFKALDKDGDGVITREEMLGAMDQLCSRDTMAPGCTNDGDGDAAFDALDVDKSGTLDYEEFVAMMSGTHSDFLAAA